MLNASYSEMNWIDRLISSKSPLPLVRWRVLAGDYAAQELVIRNIYTQSVITPMILRETDLGIVFPYAA